MLQVRGILLALGLTGKLVVVLNQALDAPGPDGAFFFLCVDFLCVRSAALERSA